MVELQLFLNRFDMKKFILFFNVKRKLTGNVDSKTFLYNFYIISVYTFFYFVRSYLTKLIEWTTTDVAWFFFWSLYHWINDNFCWYFFHKKNRRSNFCLFWLANYRQLSYLIIEQMINTSNVTFGHSNRLDFFLVGVCVFYQTKNN